MAKAMPARRMDAYIRVSRVGKRRGPSFISPDVQREAIVRWATANDVELLEIYEELDESGARADRPLLQRAVARIEEHGSDGLVVWRVDRFGRSLHHSTAIIEQIQRAGGKFISVNDGLDIDTDAGRLVLRILLSVAEYHLDGIRASWDTTRERAIRRGVFMNKAAVVGYRKTRSGRLRVDPVTGPIMTEVFRRRAQGDTVMRLCRYLEEQGVRTGKGNVGWPLPTLSHMLRSRVYLGEVYSGPYRNEKAHPPLTDPGTWEAAQHPANMRKHVQLRGLLVGGLARCAGCSHTLTPFTARKPGQRDVLHYRCRKYNAGGACPAPTHIAARKLEPYVIDAMLTILRKRRSEPAARLAAAQAKAAEATAALARYRDNDRIAAAIGEDAFIAGLVTRRHRLADANLAIASARARLGIHALPSAAEVERTFPTLTLDEQHELVAQVIDTVFVANGHGPASARVTVCPAGTAPLRLPRQGDRGRNNRTITPRRGWMNPVRTPTDG